MIKIAADFGFYMGLASIAGSIIAAFLSFLISRYHGRYKLSPYWLAVTGAFVLIIARRLLGVITELGYFLSIRTQLKFIEDGLLLVISALYIVGFMGMLKNLERIEVIEKKVRPKLKVMNKREA